MAETPTGTESASRVIDVLLLFTDGSAPLGVTRIARELGLSKAVVHRILQTLVSKGMLVADGHRRGYRLGPAASTLGSRALQDSDLRAAAIELLRELRAVTGETTTLTALIPQGRIYLEQVPSPQDIKMTVEQGRRFPLHAGASGKCMLAFLPEQHREQLLAEKLPSWTPLTRTDAGALRAEAREIQRRGYAISAGERQPDAASVAAPVLGPSGVVLGAISVCGPRYRFTREVAESVAGRLVSTARAISYRMGATDPEVFTRAPQRIEV
jgi:DNA-binding IclR family transcriptional regulator